MNSAQIENNLQKLMKSFNQETFIYDLLLAYGLPKASITRLQKGNLNLSKTEGELSWKKKLLFKEVSGEDLHLAIFELARQVKHDQRFVVVTDYKLFLAIDTKTQDKLDIELGELPKHYDFFLPWAGMEKAQHASENPADVKAAERMAKLFDEIKKDNPENSEAFVHGLNVFLSRLLFCFFAEDTKIFQEGQFTNALSSHTQADGSDLNTYLDKFFEVLNTSRSSRQNLPEYLNAFPYVNGGLFRKRFASPTFTRRSRQIIIDAGGELQWKDINPDIFGSMFQAVIGEDQRGSLGQHYTSVPNIMKVIEPLFLNDLYETFEKAKGNPKKLNELLYRISKIKIFDPACGSGNFLIIAYKELRRLEIKIIQHLQELQQLAAGFGPKSEQLSLIPKSQMNLAASFQVELFSHIHLSQFYGIELDDFAHEIAQLSLWLAEHQMNVEFKNEFGQTKPTLPLKESGNIVHGNACRHGWDEVCPMGKDDEIYILGNPPYLGYSLQSQMQKEDMKIAFKGFATYKNLDYISCWFIKAARFFRSGVNFKGSFAFVSTNSICQGEQVLGLWKKLFELEMQIQFAHLPFIWSNSAKSKAAVYCNIVGVSKINSNIKKLFSVDHEIKAPSINPYLTIGSPIFIEKRSSPISSFPEMLRGSGATDDGNLILSEEESLEITSKYSSSHCLVKPYIGSYEFINRINRFCLWIENVSDVIEMPEVIGRVEKTSIFRQNSKKINTQKLANVGHRFAEQRYVKSTSTIIIPRVSSERRKYIPIGFLNQDYVISDSANGIYNAPIWIFSVINSNMHMIWVNTLSGRLKSDYRYSSALCYNTFPFPPISEQRKQEITQCVFRIMEEREKYPEKTLAQLYDPDKMPDGLREAHRANDIVIEKCYRSKPFESDEERLEYLFKLYERMIAEEKEEVFKKKEKQKAGISKVE